MSDQPQQQIPLTTPLSVTLTVEQWRAALKAMSRGQVRKVGALMNAIEQQCSAELQRIAKQGGDAHPGEAP